MRLAALNHLGHIWTSTNSGATWTQDTSVGSGNEWSSVTSNSYGTHFAAVNTHGEIWTATDLYPPRALNPHLHLSMDMDTDTDMDTDMDMACPYSM